MRQLEWKSTRRRNATITKLLWRACCYNGNFDYNFARCHRDAGVVGPEILIILVDVARSRKSTMLITTIMILVTAMCAFAPVQAEAASESSVNEFKSGEVWTDNNGVAINAHGGGMLEFKGVYYWYGEHKTAGSAGNQAHVGVHVYSSRDLYNWADRGIALAVSQNPSSDIADGCILERPKVIYNAKTKKFVMWFHLEKVGNGYSSARAGVAIADSAIGPFTYLGSFRPNAGVWPRGVVESDKASGSRLARDFEGGQMCRDMNLFVDEDGSAYHIYSSEDNSTIQVSRLSDDYLKPAGEYVRVMAGRFREAPAMFKHDGRYYVVTSACNGWNPTDAGVCVSDSIWGPYKWLGTPCIGDPERTKVTFDSQSTFILRVPGKPDSFIFMADRWRPSNAIDGRYVWLPLTIHDGVPQVKWVDSWSLADMK